MIGRRLEDYFPAHVGADAGDELLRVEHLSSPGSFTRRVVLRVRTGEVVGCAGLVGAGRSEVARAIFGLDPLATGDVWCAAAAWRDAAPRTRSRSASASSPRIESVRAWCCR